MYYIIYKCVFDFTYEIIIYYETSKTIKINVLMIMLLYNAILSCLNIQKDTNDIKSSLSIRLYMYKSSIIV